MNVEFAKLNFFMITEFIETWKMRSDFIASNVGSDIIIIQRKINPN